jgi:RHS repeat-associated protein
VQRVTYEIDGTDYPIDLDYDDLGRTKQIHYPNHGNGQPVIAKYLYDNSGVLTGLDEVGSGTAQTLWRLNSVFQGHLIQNEAFGNGAQTTYGYHPDRRFLENIQTTLGTEQIQSLAYSHYNNGLVHTLTGAGAAQREYLYDNLNRLSFALDNPVSGVPISTPYSYDEIGNLTGRGPTVTTYQSTRPHLVDAVGQNSYIYDANGNVSSRVGPDLPGGSQVFSYTPFDLPSAITTGSHLDPNFQTIRFDYSADQERLARRDRDATRHFASDLYQRQFDSADITLEERFRLYAGERQLGEIVRKDGTDKILYFHTDHLGSTTTISDSTGATVQQHFDPFGAPLDSANAEISRVGFTGQDQDVDLGLTDMKGRIYDPLAGRFTTADPVMQAPSWSQGLNRYSYVFNDPVNNIDPGGFEADGLGYFASNPSFAGAASNTLASSVGFGVGSGLVNAGISWGSGQYDLFNGSGPSSHTVSAPSAAPASHGANGAPGAVRQNKGGVAAQWARPAPPPLPPSQTTRIRIGVTRIKQAPFVHHTFVILNTPGDSASYATRAGPTTRTGGSFGYIVTHSDNWGEAFADAPSETDHVQIVGISNHPIAQIKEQIRAFNEALNKAKIPYSPTGPNSNTYTNEFLHSIGITGVVPDEVAPGWWSGFGDVPFPKIP